MRRNRGGKPSKKPAKKKPAGTKGDGRPFPLKRVLRLGGIGAVLAFGLGYVFSTRVLFPAPAPAGDLVVVPDVRGTAEGDAHQAGVAAGFTVVAPDRYRHPTVPFGQVLGQSPLPGQLAAPGDTLWMTVSLGAERRPVPDVLRLREDWARNVLEASGFTVLADTLQSELPKGRVAEIIPEPGTDVALPMEVQILISTGPAQIRMPLLLGRERAEAEALIDSVGLILEDVSTRFRFGRDQGRVVEQEPPADSLLDPGAGVRIVVGRRARRGGR